MAEIQVVDFETALKRIVQTANADSLLAKGIHEVSKALESKDEKVKAKYVILAKNCTEANYVKIVKGLAAQNKVSVCRRRCKCMRSKRERLWESGWASARSTRTAASPRRENALQSPSGTSLQTSRRRRRKSSWLSWADDDYSLYNQKRTPSCFAARLSRLKDNGRSTLQPQRSQGSPIEKHL